MEIDFKSLSAEQETLLRKILSRCDYLMVSSTWRPTLGDSVIRKVAEGIGDDYRALTKTYRSGTEKARQQNEPT
jgi:hypothetical protein